MTEQPEQHLEHEHLDDGAGTPELLVEVRRNTSLSAAVGGLSALLTVAFAARAFTGGTGLDWLAFAVLVVVTAVHLTAVIDSRAPLLVADGHGVRLRQGSRWRGIAWPEIDCLEHLPRRGLLRDGHLLVDGYDDQQLVVPLTLATRITGATNSSLSDVLADLADGRADVVEVVPGLDQEPPPAGTKVPTLSDLYRDDEPAVPGERHGIAARVAAGLSGQRVLPEDDGPYDVEADVEADVDAEYAHPDADADADAEDTGEIRLGDDDRATDEIAAVVESPEPGRATVLAARVELSASPRPAADPLADPLTGPAPAPTTDATVLLPDLAVAPAAQPVVGPELAAARERLRLTIDQLSERTRIRPHVIEAIEVDDFAPCGGDFYARGHLRTLARVLGIDAAPLLTAYDEHYADAPVDPRRVFESELATAGGTIRSTRGGRNWSVLIAFVMASVLVWSVARLVMDAPAPLGDTPVLNQSGGITNPNAAQGKPVRLTLTAAGGGAELVVRDGAGSVVFDDNLAFGQTTELDVVPPVRIWSSDGSVTYALGGDDAAALGDTGIEVSKTLVAR